MVNEVSKCLRTLTTLTRDVTAAFSDIERESTKMSLAVNEGKTKYMLSAGK